MENITTIYSRGLPFIIRTEKFGDTEIVEEVVGGDCYDLIAMREAGRYPEVIFDIGASMGAFARWAHFLFPEATIFCFEPNKRSFELLKENCPFATCYNAAVRYDGSSILTDGEGATGGGFITTREKFEEMAASKNSADHFIYSIFDEVPTVSLEEVCEEHGIENIDILKIDCEGSEWDIFRGMKPETAAKINKIIGEYHLNMAGEDSTFDAFRALVLDRFNKIIVPRRLATIELFFTI